MNAVSRRSALKAGLAGAALAAPAVASAQQTYNWKMTSAYGKGSPFSWCRSVMIIGTGLYSRTTSIRYFFGSGIAIAKACSIKSSSLRSLTNTPRAGDVLLRHDHLFDVIEPFS